MYKALLFDLNGTMIDDMHFHTKAWFDILTKVNPKLTWEEVEKEMYGKNPEVLIRVFGKEHFSEEQINTLSIDKEKRYQSEFFPHLKLIDGLDEFLQGAKENNLKIAIASAAITSNIDFVIDNLNIRSLFDAIVSADDVKTSKPNPETFLKAAELVEVPASECIVFEDAPKGVEAAYNAGMKAVVLTTMHAKEEFLQYKNIVAFAENYTDPFFHQLLENETALTAEL